MAQPQPPPAQQQQHYAHPPRAYSPPQNMNSPGEPQQQFAQPPSKRQKLSPNPPNAPSHLQNGASQPLQHQQNQQMQHNQQVQQPMHNPQPQSNGVPNSFQQAPYTNSPGGATHNSPHFANVGIPPSLYNTPLAPSPSPSYSTPYGNGHTPTINMPPQQRQQGYQNSPFPSPQGHPNHHQPNLQTPSQGNFNSYQMSMQQSGTMGPPLKPADKSRDDIDPMDVLGGTGINLHEEEQALFNGLNSFDSQQSGTMSSGRSFTQYPPGNEGSFYGAGFANSPTEHPDDRSREEYIARQAQRSWDKAASDLAMSRQRDFAEQFVDGGMMHHRMATVAGNNGLTLKWDERKGMGEFKRPADFARTDIRSHTITGPNGSMTAINGTFMPNDTALIDHSLLMSLALKHRLRGLIEDAVKLSDGRQKGSHGIVPEEWADVADAAPGSSMNSVEDGATIRAGWESAVSPLTQTPLKRPAPLTNAVKKTVQFPNDVMLALRAAATEERDFEEARLKARLARAAGESANRQGSVAPGTPGTATPEPEKGSTKKEIKKKQENKATEAATHAAANNTTSQFLGGRKKKYSWMNAGAGGGGASTPGRLTTSGLPAVPGGPVLPPQPEKLTVEAARRLGQWREDQTRGKKVQLRDWIAVLEQDGQAKKSLQKAYLNLDTSDPKGM